LIGLTRAVALEDCKEMGLRATRLCPGTSASPVHEEAIAQMMANEGLSPVAAEMQFLAGKRRPAGWFLPRRRGLIAFLCTEAAADITGATIPVDAAGRQADSFNHEAHEVCNIHTQDHEDISLHKCSSRYLPFQRLSFALFVVKTQRLVQAARIARRSTCWPC
jgi:hypothetical protein